MITQEQYLLIVLAEECVETAQRATKALRFGMKEIQPGQSLTNSERISGEVNDLMATLIMLGQLGGLGSESGTKEVIQAAIESKIIKVKKYMDYSRELGVLE